VLFLALSCLQGRPMGSAFDELAAFGGGVQLTPGNHPTGGFEARVGAAATRRHHGFAFAARKREVWTADARCLVDAESVHPPQVDTSAARAVEVRGLGAWIAETQAREAAPLLETMYPGYLLGDGEALEVAMDAGARLAVDVSHVFIQLTAGAMRAATWERLMQYAHIGEVHVSANDGTRDAHAPLDARTFGLAWARERAAEGVPIVLECYMHRLSRAERERQVELVVGSGSGAGGS
jgi:hypothetical protein